jgi:hypothetical protein
MSSHINRNDPQSLDNQISLLSCYNKLATFNNISVLLVEETGENQTTDLSHITDKLAMSGI